METLICTFIVSSLDRKVEDIWMYDDENYTEDQIIEVIEKIVKERKIVVGEKCEGDLSITDGGKIVIQYKYCSEVGEDWNEDVWVDGDLCEVDQMVYGL